MSFSLLLCLLMNFIAVTWPVYFLRPLYTYTGPTPSRDAAIRKRPDYTETLRFRC